MAGRGADAEVFLAVGAVAESHRKLLLAGALQRRAIGKMLLAGGAAVAEILPAGAPWWNFCRPGAPWRRAIRKMLLAGAPL